MTTTTFDDLPRDLVEEILSRAPLKSKKAIQLTCKKWNTYLTTMHQRILAAKPKEGESWVITLMHSNLYLTSVVVNENPSAKHLGKLTCLNEQVKIWKVFHCEGLLLCIFRDYYNYTKVGAKIVVWNPYWEQTRWIDEPTYPHQQGELGRSMDRYMYALGYVNNKSCRNYKILRSYVYSYDEKRYYQIYDFDSDLWTTLDVPPQWRICFHQSSISLKGNSYWCASPEEKDNEDHIICFDFTRERFGPITTNKAHSVGLITSL